MKLKELEEMLEEDKELEDCELNPPHVNWGPWAGDLDLDSLLREHNKKNTSNLLAKNF